MLLALANTTWKDFLSGWDHEVVSINIYNYYLVESDKKIILIIANSIIHFYYIFPHTQDITIISPQTSTGVIREITQRWLRQFGWRDKTAGI